MSITINFESQAGKGLDSIEIYRTAGRAVFDYNSPGGPIVTLAQDATSYTDENVELGMVYNYYVCNVKAGQRVYSSPINAAYVYDLGPGPQKLLFGNWNAGYFGKLSEVEFLSKADLDNLLPINITTSPYSWHKFVYDGKILFIPQTSLHGSVSWSVLYSYGLVYGNAKPVQEIITQYGAVRTPCVIRRENDEFIVRCPRLGRDFTKMNSYSTDQVRAGEDFQTYRRLFAGFSNDNLGHVSDLSWVGYRYWFADMTTNISNAYYSWDVDSVSNMRCEQSTAWLPVLELVPKSIAPQPLS